MYFAEVMQHALNSYLRNEISSFLHFLVHKGLILILYTK